MKRFPLYLLLVLLVWACNNSDQSADEPDEETMPGNETIISDSSMDINDMVIRNMAPWSNFVEMGPALKADSFRIAQVWEEDSLITDPFRPDSNFYKLYGPFLKYSPDSAYFIDLDSYNIILEEKDGTISGFEGGPDNQIFLVDRENGIRERLMFNGPNIYVHDAWWIDHENIAMVGVSQIDSVRKWKPLIWKVNIRENLFEQYDYIGSGVSDTLPEYTRKVRFKGLRIR